MYNEQKCVVGTLGMQRYSVSFMSSKREIDAADKQFFSWFVNGTEAKKQQNGPLTYAFDTYDDVDIPICAWPGKKENGKVIMKKQAETSGCSGLDSSYFMILIFLLIMFILTFCLLIKITVDAHSAKRAPLVQNAESPVRALSPSPPVASSGEDTLKITTPLPADKAMTVFPDMALRVSAARFANGLYKVS